MVGVGWILIYMRMPFGNPNVQLETHQFPLNELPKFLIFHLLSIKAAPFHNQHFIQA
jgi:hypothetical protein